MIVLDSCALVEMASKSNLGLALKEMQCSKEKAISCTLARAEVASVARKYTRTQGISAQGAEVLLVDALSLVDEFYPIEVLQSEALQESIRLDHSVYDMFYFVLARRTGGTLFTTDKKLMDLCAAHGVNCLDEAEFPALAESGQED